MEYSNYIRILKNWSRQNAESIYNHLERNNPDVNWREEPIEDIVIDWLPRLDEDNDGKFIEDMYHVLDDHSFDFGIPIPPEALAYCLSVFVGKSVPTTHPFITNSKYWREIVIDISDDCSNKSDEIRFIKLLRGITADENLLENLPTVQDVEEYYESPTGDGKIFIINSKDSLIYLAVSDEYVAAMNDDGKVVVLDFDGNKLDIRTDRIKSYIISKMKYFKEIADNSELASLVGNQSADMILGTHGFSVFDLPD